MFFRDFPVNVPKKIQQYIAWDLSEHFSLGRRKAREYYLLYRELLGKFGRWEVISGASQTRPK